MNEFPRWKYILVAVVLLLGFVYALPIVFTPQLAVQISANRGATVDAALKEKVLGILQTDPRKFLQGGSAEGWIGERIAAREAARKGRDFAQADAIRKELLEKGIVLEDKGGKTSWRRL